MNTLQILEAGLALIRDPNKWAQQFLALNAQNDEVEPLDPTACSWCSIGALVKASGNPLFEGFAEMRHLEQAIGENTPGIAVFNDYSTHEQVIKVWEKAIEYARSAAQGPGPDREPGTLGSE